jgi:acyl carrier protein
MERARPDVREVITASIEKRAPGTAAALSDEHVVTKPPIELDSLGVFDLLGEISELLDVQLEDKEDLGRLLTVGALVRRFQQLVDLKSQTR